MTTTEQPTLEHKVETATNLHDTISAEIKGPEIRVYETKTLRKLASGEIREYTLKQHYVVKKKPGPCATILKTQAANLRAKIAKTMMPFSLRSLQLVDQYCHATELICETPRPSNTKSLNPVWPRLILRDTLEIPKDQFGWSDTTQHATVSILDIELDAFYRLCFASMDIGKIKYPYAGAMWEYIRGKCSSIEKMITLAMGTKELQSVRNKVIFETAIAEMKRICEDCEMCSGVS